MRARELTGRHAVHGQRRGFTRQTITHDPLGSDGEPDPHLARDLALTKRIADKLEAHYPGHPWMVQVSHLQGVAYIKIPILMKRNEAWVLHIDKILMDPGLRCVMRAGGAILEKHNVPRAQFMIDHFLNARDLARPKRRFILPT